MTPHLPVEDPSQGTSLLDMAVGQVRQSLLLRVLLTATAIDSLGIIVLAFAHRIHFSLAGAMILFTCLAWFFAVGMPLMNREIRFQLEGRRAGYLTELLEMFFRVVLAATTLLFTAMVVYAAVGSI